MEIENSSNHHVIYLLSHIAVEPVCQIGIIIGGTLLNVCPRSIVLLLAVLVVRSTLSPLIALVYYPDQDL